MADEKHIRINPGPRNRYKAFDADHLEGIRRIRDAAERQEKVNGDRCNCQGPPNETEVCSFCRRRMSHAHV